MFGLVTIVNFNCVQFIMSTSKMEQLAQYGRIHIRVDNITMFYLKWCTRQYIILDFGYCYIKGCCLFAVLKAGAQ